MLEIYLDTFRTFLGIEVFVNAEFSHAIIRDRKACLITLNPDLANLITQIKSIDIHDCELRHDSLTSVQYITFCTRQEDSSFSKIVDKLLNSGIHGTRLQATRDRNLQHVIHDSESSRSRVPSFQRPLP